MLLNSLQCAIDGYSTGQVDYNRKKKYAIGNRWMFAKSLLQKLMTAYYGLIWQLKLVVEQIEGAIEFNKCDQSLILER
jgi:hypothetical protein